jgi:2-polyprenyl-3-methyl-5-hydroxy-6-metoxy-1,4-benzoquinol methylase
MNNFWDNRYSGKEFVFGKNPNAFLRSVIDKLPPGKILVPAAGEGRDAVYAAKLGWKVFAFDQSIVGQQKALQYAKDENVSINYEVTNALDFDFAKNSYDVIALIYFHLPSHVREQFHSNIIKSLSQNGLIILEAFNPKQISNTSGGPSDVSMLMTVESLQKEFSDLQIIECKKQQIFLDEGLGHTGKADVVRLVGKKIMHLL